MMLCRPRKYSEVNSEKAATFFYCYKSCSALPSEEKNGNKIIMEFKQLDLAKNSEEMKEVEKEACPQEMGTFFNFESQFSQCCEEIMF